MDKKKVIRGLELCEIGSGDRCYETECPYYGQRCTEGLKKDILVLLKEQEAVVKQWTKEIADNQLANAPMDSPMSLDEHLECEYKRGIWDGLEIAWNIISEGR